MAAIKAVIGVFLALAASQSLAQGNKYCLSPDPPRTYATDAFYDPMQYRLYQYGEQRILIAEGGIGDGESLRLTAALDQYAPIDEVWFNSSGGRATEGPFMGRVLRKRSLAVRIPRNFGCFSACTYAFLGGVIRDIDPGGVYAVHMFTIYGNDPAQYIAIINQHVRYDQTRKNLIKAGNAESAVDLAIMEIMQKDLRFVEQDSAQTAAIRARYLVEMSASLEFMTDAFGQGAGGFCHLNPAGLKRYNVVNTAQ